MPPKATLKALPQSTPGDSDGEVAQQELAELLDKMRRSANDRRRKKREQLETSHMQELQEVKAEKRKQLIERYTAANRRRTEYLRQLQEVVERKHGIEKKLADVLREIEVETSDILEDIRSMQAGALVELSPRE